MFGLKLKESPVSLRTAVTTPTGTGAEAVFVSFDGFPPTREHFAYKFGDFTDAETPFTRIHSVCVRGDLFNNPNKTG